MSEIDDGGHVYPVAKTSGELHYGLTRRNKLIDDLVVAMVKDTRIDIDWAIKNAIKIADATIKASKERDAP